MNIIPAVRTAAIAAFAVLTLISTSLVAQPYEPCAGPHALRRPSFNVPRARVWDFENCKYFGGGTYDNCEECGCGHGPHRNGVWDCSHYVVPLPPSRWTVDIDAVFLQRVPADDITLLSNDTTGDPAFFASDFEFDWEGAPRLSAQLFGANGNSIEFRYQGFFEFAQSREFDDAVDDLQNNLAGLNIVTANPFLAYYETQFQSAEVNLRRNCQHVSVFAGVRWLQLDEEFRLTEDIAAADTLLVATENQLIGMQLGIEGSHWVNYGIMKLDGSIRGGVYHNTAESRAEFGVNLAADAGKHLAWVGEAAINANFPVTKYVWFRIGYEAIHTAGVAVAFEQFPTTDVTVPITAIDTNGTLLLHGWSIGLHAQW